MNLSCWEPTRIIEGVRRAHGRAWEEGDGGRYLGADEDDVAEGREDALAVEAPDDRTVVVGVGEAQLSQVGACIHTRLSEGRGRSRKAEVWGDTRR